MPDMPSWVKVNPSKLHLSKFLCYEITKNSLVLSNELSLKASHGDKSSKRFDVLNYLETPNCDIEGQSASWRPLNNHELIRSPPLRAWEGPLRLAAPWLIVLTNWPTCETLEQPVAAQHQRLIIWAAPPQFWLAGSQMNHDGIALKETNNPSCGKCLNSPKMIISLSSGLPAALIQFRGADYLCRSWPKGNPIPEFSSWISMQISKTLSTIMLKLGSETGSICRGWNKLLLENGDAHANLKRVETNAKEEAQQGGRGLNGKAVPP